MSLILSKQDIAPHKGLIDQDVMRLADWGVRNLLEGNTRRAYWRAIAAYAHYLKTTGQNIGRDSLIAWKNNLLTVGRGDEGLSPSTVNQALTAVRLLAQELSYDGRITDAVFRQIDTVPTVPRRGHKLGNWLQENEAQAILDAITDTGVRGKRDKAIFGLLLFCALRREELVSLTLSNIQRRNDRWVIVGLKGKGGVDRVVHLPQVAHAALDAYLQVAKHNPQEGLFARVGAKGRPSKKAGLTTQAIYYLVRDAAVAANIDFPLSPHDLRRTSARLMYDRGVPLKEIQQILGHGSVATTEIYLGLFVNLDNPGNDAIALEL